MGDLYKTSVPWSDVGIDQKLPLMKFVESKAKSMDEAVEKVAVYWADQDERVMIATLDGKLVTDHRPMTRVTVTVTARRGEEVQSGFSNIAAREEFGWYTDERLATMVKEAVMSAWPRWSRRLSTARWSCSTLAGHRQVKCP
jgi:TldD protein